MKKNRTAFAVLAAGLMVTTACSSSGSTTTGSGTTGGAVKKNASIVVIANSLPNGLDPDSTSSTDSGIEQVVTTNYMGLLYSANGVSSADGVVPQPKPDLATSGSLSADGKTFTIKLRPNVKSNTGNPLTADDVVWTFKRIENAKATGSSLLSQINIDPTNPATAVDSQTVALHMTAPSALVPSILALPFTGIIDATEAKKHVTASDPYATAWLNKNVASFGPYTVQSNTPGSSMVLVANPNYWQGTPSVTRATFRVVQDAGTTLQTALTGQSDMTLTLPYSDLATLQKSPQVTVHQLPVPSVVYMTLDLKNPELTDPRVRQAIALASDRTAVSNTVFSGAAKPITSCLPAQLTSATTPDDNAASPQIAKAKALLAQVPGQHSLVIGILPTAFPEGATISRIIQSNLEAIGMKVTLKTYSSFGPIVADAKAHTIGSLVLEQAPFVLDAGYFFKAFFLGSSLFNYSSYANPAFDAASNAAMAETAPARNAQIAKACSLFTADAPADMLVEAGAIQVTKKDVTNVQSFADIDPRLFNLRISS